MPPVIRAEANSVVDPSTKPKAGPYDAAAEHEEEEDELDAAGAGAEGSQHRPDGGEHAEHRESLGVHPPSGHLGEHDGDQHRAGARRTRRGRRACGRSRPGGLMTRGHANMASPATEATSRATAVRGAMPSTERSRRIPAGGGHAARSGRGQCDGDLVDGEPPVGVQHLGDLGCEGRARPPPRRRSGRRPPRRRRPARPPDRRCGRRTPRRGSRRRRRAPRRPGCGRGR